MPVTVAIRGEGAPIQNEDPLAEGKKMATYLDSICKILQLLGIVFVLYCSGCAAREVSIDDPILSSFKTMYLVNRKDYGLTALPKTGRVTIEEHGGWWARKHGYDAMLHIRDGALRNIAFRRNGNTYEWVGEQEICTGPRSYASENGVFHEQVEINVFHGVPYQFEGLLINYRGPDENLKTKLRVTIADIVPLLRQWGCDE